MHFKHWTLCTFYAAENNTNNNNHHIMQCIWWCSLTKHEERKRRRADWERQETEKQKCYENDSKISIWNWNLSWNLFFSLFISFCVRSHFVNSACFSAIDSLCVCVCFFCCFSFCSCVLSFGACASYPIRFTLISKNAFVVFLAQSLSVFNFDWKMHSLSMDCVFGLLC